MKRTLGFFITIAIVVFLFGCTNVSKSSIESNENNMIITIQNNANFAFYGLEAQFRNHTQGTANADGSMIEHGDRLSFELHEDDLPLHGEVTLEVSILPEKPNDKGVTRIPVKQNITFELERNTELVFEVTGESLEEAEIKRVN